tara:strand:+ start:262 stop:1386 length:1125 start_codon:yes stop_codon:yes gene_type:complete
MISFNKQFIAENEIKYINNSLSLSKQSGDGKYTKMCYRFFGNHAKHSKPLLTTSCTHSLEMAALILDIKNGDEIIMPSYTFPSTANPFLLRGAKIVFCDSQARNPNISVKNVESLITEKTKAIVPVHYAGISCEMDQLLKLAKRHNIKIIEDAAQSIGSFYMNKPLGTIGDIGCVSFHDSKNITCGEGGLIYINNRSFVDIAEIIREKGTNRSAFLRGEIDKYSWESLGSSYLLADILAAKLIAQLEKLNAVTRERIKIWNNYYENLLCLQNQNKCELPFVPKYCKHNGHIFFLICKNGFERYKLINFLKKNGVQATFHYQSLHKSKFFKSKYFGKELKNSNKFEDCLIRLPIYPGLTKNEQFYIIEKIIHFFK